MEASPFVVEGSLRAYRTSLAGHTYVITCQVRWHVPAAVRDSRIQQPEPVALWFMDSSEHSAPEMRSDREDFPRDLPHLNETAPGEPVSICLAREGTASLYRRTGMAGLLERAATWLRDAASRTLDHDGWEPVPVLGLRTAVLDIGWFQKFARGHSPKTGGFAAGTALVFGVPLVGGGTKTHFQLIPDRKRLREVWSEEASRFSGRHTVEALWLFAWGPQLEPVATRFGRRVDRLDSLLQFADHSLCGAELRRCIDVLCDPRAATKGRRFLLLIGTWRPRALIPGIPGLASGSAAALELSGFEVEIGLSDGKTSVTAVERMRLVSDATPAALRELAGHSKPFRRAVLVGAGALGSKTAEHLVREGLDSIVIADSDRFEPHNLARHTLDRRAIHFGKAFELESHLKRIVPELHTAAVPVDVAQCKAAELGTHADDVIIDATANWDVTTRLCQSDIECHRAIKVEIADEGRLGIVYVEGAGRNPRLDDLKAMLPALSLSNDHISRWLRRQPGEAVLTGIGCASASMEMSDSRVALHAANLMPTVSTVLTRRQTPGIGVGALGPAGHLQHWYWFDAPRFVQFPPNARDDAWKVRASEILLTDLSMIAARNGPSEAGGYLYGHFDARSRTIHVVWAANPPPLEAGPSGLKLPPAASSEEELHALGASADHLRLLGTWHSHPSGSSHPSDRDLLQCAEDAVRSASRACPHIVLIHGRDGWRLLTGLPALWC